MNNVLLVTFLMFAFVFGLIGCNESDDPVSAEELLISRTWERFNHDDNVGDYLVQIRFKSDGVFEFNLPEPVEGHTSSRAKFTADDLTITIFDDTDCEVTGYYKYSVTKTTLTLVAENDECAPRINAIAGEWHME